MTNMIFDDKAKEDDTVRKNVETFLGEIKTLEVSKNLLLLFTKMVRAQGITLSAVF